MTNARNIPFDYVSPAKTKNIMEYIFFLGSVMEIIAIILDRTARKILDAGLPEFLAERLFLGR